MTKTDTPHDADRTVLCVSSKPDEILTKFLAACGWQVVHAKTTALAERVIPDYAGAKDLSPAQRDRLFRSVDVIEQWLAGSLEFHRISTRHTDHRAEGVNPFSSR